jgi:GNAT superfamily N-acetyltransferase
VTLSYSFEPLADHDRAAFHCGNAELDEYMWHRASQDARRKVAAPFVMVDAARQILGYYTLSAYSIRVVELPPELAKKLPKYPLIPATMLGRLAVSEDHRGKKLGTLLLMDALHRSWKTAKDIASLGVIAEAIGDVARTFYLHHEFRPLPEHPRKLFVAMVTVETVFG